MDLVKRDTFILHHVRVQNQLADTPTKYLSKWVHIDLIQLINALSR